MFSNPFAALLCASLLCVLALTALPASAAPSPQVPTVPRFAKFEAAFTLPGQTGNPYDPADNDITVVFAGPKNTQGIVPAFWDGDRWRVRFAPAVIGAYTLSVRRSGKAVTPPDLAPARFTCTASSGGGFVRRDPKFTQRFMLDNGQTYYPFGINAAWTGGPLTDYDSLFAQMHKSGLNWARVWMTYWDGKALDWSPDKSKNPKPGEMLLDAARRWDVILDAADKNDVYVQMTLQHHGPYTEKTDSNWRDNPYNTANGGFLAHPDDFFTDARARHLTRLKYRYIVARYGYSPHLLAWELFNEVQNIGEANTHFADVLAWHKEMAAAIRAEDVNHHLVTTSYTAAGEPLSQIGLDYDQPHAYPTGIISYFAALPLDTKPLFTGEWGPADAKAHLTTEFLHDGLWSGLMTPAAGAGQFWYWDAVMRENWWPQFESATGFLRAFGVSNHPGLTALLPQVSSSGPRGDLLISPPDGWGTFKRTAFTLPSNGLRPDLGGMSSFIQGKNHPEMMPQPLTFAVDCSQPAQFRLDIGTIAKEGAHPVLSLDGNAGTEKDFPASEADHNVTQTLSLDLPAGKHVVTLANTGQDWFVVQNLSVTNYAPPVAVLARGGKNAAVFWAYTQARTAASSGPTALSLTGLDPGHYTVRLWDTWAGKELPSVNAAAKGGQLQITLPPFSRDIAGIATAAPK